MTQKLEKIKYFCVEMIGKKHLAKTSVITEIEKEIIYGLFAGMKVIVLDKIAIPFIIIYTPEKKYKILNLSTHNVVSIEHYDGVTRNYVYLRSTDEDQKAAFDIITSATADFMSERRMRKDNVFINIDSFSDLPEGFTNPGKTTTGVKKTVTQSSYAGTGNHNRTANNTNYWNNVNKTPTILFYKRVSEKPTKSLLTKMREFVNQVSEGTYEHPEFKDIDVPTVTVNNTAENFRHMYGADDYS
jgi:hypothetical protein